MLRTLIRLRVRLWWSTERADGTMFLVGGILLLVIVGVGLWATRVMFTLIHDRTTADPGVILLTLFLGVGTFQLLAAVRHGVDRLYLAPDLELLLTAPVRERDLFAAKLFEVVAASPMSVAGLTVLSLGYARASGSAVALLFAVPAVVALSVLMTLPGLILSLLLVRLVPPARLQLALTLVPMLLVLPITFAGPAMSLRASRGGQPPDLSGLLEGLTAAVAWMPTSWPAYLVVGPVDGRWGSVVLGLGLTAAVVLTMGSAALHLFRTGFLSSWGRVHEAPPRVRRGGVLERLVPPLPPPMRAIVLKDWRTLTRDPKAASSLFFLILALGYILVAATRSGGAFVLGFAPMIVGSFLMQSFEQEGRSFAMIRATPVPIRTIFHAKLVAYLLPMAAGLWLALAIATAAGRFTAGHVVVIGISAPILLAGVGAISLSFASIGTQHRADPPKVAPQIGLLSGIVSIVFFVPNYIFTAWMLALVEGDRSGFTHPLMGLILLALSATAWAGVAALVRRAVARLDALEIA